MNNYSDLTFRQMSFDKRVKQEYDLWIALFGEKEAKKRFEEQKPLTNAMRKLWNEQKCQNYGEYLDWEENHIQERNEFLKKEGVWDIWVKG